jgi:hypothetical protein
MAGRLPIGRILACAFPLANAWRTAVNPTNSLDAFSAEQRDLWQRVVDLWELAISKNPEVIRATLHPRYVGWDMRVDRPHDREAAVRAVSGDSPSIAEYHLTPHSVEVYEDKVGIAHYSYSAIVVPRDAQQLTVTGKWTEVYLKQRGTWIMIGVAGRPD